MRSTFRPEVIGDIGGFGGLFALDLARYRQPVLVSSTDGVGTKALVAQAVGQFDDHRRRPGGHVRRRPGVPGRRAAVLPRLHRRRPARPGPHRAAGRGRRRGLSPGGVRADRRRDGRAPGCHGGRGVRPRRLLGGHRRARRARHRHHDRPRRRAHRHRRRPTCAPTATPSPAGCCSTGPPCPSTVPPTRAPTTRSARSCWPRRSSTPRRSPRCAVPSTCGASPTSPAAASPAT